MCTKESTIIPLFICSVNRSILKTILVQGGTVHSFLCHHYSSTKAEKCMNTHYFRFKSDIFEVIFGKSFRNSVYSNSVIVTEQIFCISDIDIF